MNLSKELLKTIRETYSMYELKEILLKEDYHDLMVAEILKGCSWKINNEGLIDVSGDIHLIDLDIEELPFSMGNVDGAIYVFSCKNLKSLKGFPRSCSKVVLKNLPKLKTLENFPKDVKHVEVNNVAIRNLKGICHFTNKSILQLTNLNIADLTYLTGEEFDIFIDGVKLNSLNGCPNVENIEMYRTSLETLRGIPQSLKRIKMCYIEGLKNLQGGPSVCIEFVVGYCNDLVSFEGAPSSCKMFRAYLVKVKNLIGLGDKYDKLYVTNISELVSLEGTPKYCKIIRAIENPKLSSLAGLPEDCALVDVSGSAITSLKGINSKCGEIVCYNCNRLSDISDAPENCILAVPPKFKIPHRDYRWHRDFGVWDFEYPFPL